MFRNSYQGSWITLFFSGGSKPLQIWDTHIKGGYVTRFLDPELRSMVFEIRGNNVSTNYMVCPKGKQVLGINMPFLIMIVKNLNKCFCFEVTVRDSTNTRRRFRVANFQSYTQVLPYSTVMPICLENGWNQVIFNLSDFTRRTYGKNFLEVESLKINANIRIKRIYFTLRLFDDSDLPNEYRLYFPPTSKGKKKESEKKENQAFEVQPQKEEPRIVQEEQYFPVPTMRRGSSTDDPPQKDGKENEKEDKNKEKEPDQNDNSQQEKEFQRNRSPSLSKKKGQSVTILKSRLSMVSTDTISISHLQPFNGQPSALRIPSTGLIPERTPAMTEVLAAEELEEAAADELKEAAAEPALAPLEEPVHDEPESRA